MPYGAPTKMKGSWMSKHVQNLFKEMPIDNKASALEMKKGSAAYMKDDMAPKMESPMEKELKGKQKNLPEALQKAIEASPAEMNQAPTMKKGSMAHKQGYNARLDESLGTKNGKKSQSLKDRRDESKGMEKSKGKGAYSSDSQMS